MHLSTKYCFNFKVLSCATSQRTWCNFEIKIKISAIKVSNQLNFVHVLELEQKPQKLEKSEWG